MQIFSRCQPLENFVNVFMVSNLSILLELATGLSVVVSMATARYTRIHVRNSSSNWSAIAIVGFVCLCLVAGWMIVSSSVSPLQNARISFQQIIGAREYGNMSSEESQNVSDKGQEQQVATDGSDDNEKVISSDEKSKVKCDEVDPHDIKTGKMTQEKSNNVVPDDNGEITRDDGAYKMTDGPTMSVPVVSPVEFQQDELEKNATNEVQLDEMDKNATNEVPNQGMDFDGSSRYLGNKTSEIPISNETLNELEEGRVENPSLSLEKVGQNQTEDSEKASTENALQTESEKEKASQGVPLSEKQRSYSWKLCNTSAGPDYIPCLDNIKAIERLRSTKHYEHRERHCPNEPPTCLVPLPERYRSPVKWPKSRDKIWFSNVPHTQLAQYKGRQNWVKVSGQFIIFPGGGTQFPHGAPHYIDLIQQAIPEIAWGKRTRVILDVGCGVASFGGYLFDKDVLTISMAPKDEHEAQVQFALERGIPAISGVMGTKRLHFPSKVFDIVHCSRCRVPWHIEGGKLLLELNRVLRPGGYFVWSATPVYRKNDVDVAIWEEMYRLTKSICWELVKISRDNLNRKATALFRKTTSNDCYQSRPQNDPPLCEESDDPDEYNNESLHPQAPRGCIRPWVSVASTLAIKDSEVAVYGKPAPKDFIDDCERWKHFVSESYINHVEIDWPSVRNVMDMRAVYGGFAAALKDLQVWVMDVVPIDSTNTLPLIYERGLLGIYHDWCESFNTYPRTYDLLHADHLFADLRQRCSSFVAVMAEVDRILRPGGKLVVIDDAETIIVVRGIAKSLKWMILFNNARSSDRILCVKKSLWRPMVFETVESAFA
ncbi:hypothetical protein Cgig2_010311 [Carnegiea gigantea]|uniref:Methyltransferase n=1 Tax=Carnegiea gigantea TaxID=171969 RepID=A0A9Q1QIV4_9CARY|nr:hypothetical protein Cgig2_010311 [Carnegiea gigantea]